VVVFGDLVAVKDGSSVIVHEYGVRPDRSQPVPEQFVLRLIVYVPAVVDVMDGNEVLQPDVPPDGVTV
jgi:hypothetical protein